MLDLNDLRAVISQLTSDEGKADLKSLGGVSAQTAGVILRALVNLEAEGGDTFFGEPELEPKDLLRLDDKARGVISLLELGDQAARPVLFSTFLMWVLSDLFRTLPEIGDVDKPKLVFFFDEAHLLFADASKAFLEQVEQTVKLIRSRGVGVFFCTQLPTDVPNEVLSQLGARIQHALRAFTPDDQKALTKTVRTYPKTDVYDLASALTSLGIGEAVVTVLSETRCADTGRLDQAALTPFADGRDRKRRDQAPRPSAALCRQKYGETVDSPSAYEKLEAEKAKAPAEQPAATGSKNAPEPAKKPGWFSRFVNSRGFQTFLKALGTELIRNMFGGGTKRRR